MILSRSSDFNINYAAKIIDVKEFTPHPNPTVTKLKCCTADGFNIIVGIDAQPGWYIYFPVGCAINDEFLHVNNLYRDKTYNKDQEATPGFFELNNRVRAINLKNERSEGFLMPVSSLFGFIDELLSSDDLDYNFDTISGKLLCKKYIVKNTPGKGNNSKKVKKSQFTHLVEDQFRFHVDTILLRKVPYVIKPDSLISVSSKVHGTSGISANLLHIFPLYKNPIQKYWRKLLNKPLYEEHYRDVYASRTVIKDTYNNPDVNGGFYGVDVWNIAHEVLKPCLQKGLSFYYEIIGFLPTGSYIQKSYDYGCEPPTANEVYTYGKHFKIKIYRITYTNPSGIVYEFSFRQMQQFCKKNDLDSVDLLYYGYAKDLYPDLDITDHWNENFIKRLASDKNFYMEMDSPDCKNKVPHEGIVIRNETLDIDVYKLKCLRFLQKEDEAMDRGEIDIEG